MEYEALLADLEHALGKEQVQFDYKTRLLYSTDASQYQLMPIGVTFPRHAEDVEAIHAIARQYQVPILPRGGGTSLAGQTVNTALVMDFTRHLRRVRSINAETQSVTVEPGLVLDHLNQQVKSLGLMYGPDPASSNRATVGGMIGNNSTGSHSILYGMTADHVRRIEVLFSNGERAWLDANTAFLRDLRTKIGTISAENEAEIIQRYPKTWRTVAGYALNKIVPENPNLNWLISGSEGTLCTILQAELSLVPIPKQQRLAILHFDTLLESLEITPKILETNPSAVELIDRFLLDKTRRNAHFAPLLSGLIDGDPAAILIVEYYGESDAELSAKIDHLLNHLSYHGAVTHAVTRAEQARVWEVRKAGLGLLLSERSDTKPVEFIEDAAVPVDQLANYIRDIEAIIRSEGTTFAIYAHASAGCLHIRPLINLKSVKGLAQYRRIAEAAADLVIQYGGTTTGEHGEGISRSEFNQRLFGEKLTHAFREIKHAFDPDNLMNPGKIVDPPYRMDDPGVMRFGSDYRVLEVNTRFDWSYDHGLNGAAEMCNGAGVCRKTGSGTMCPSYMATLDEAHSTRGRANMLRHAMTGTLPGGLASESLHEVFDLCLSCKACQAECPSSVDVAKMKAEFLAAYQDAHGTSIATRAFGNIHRLNRLGSLAPRLSNAILNSPIGLAALKFIGMPTERPLPRLAHQTFTSQINNHPANPKATLIVDTFTEFNHPEVGLALKKITDAMGIALKVMQLPAQGCCGRPAISKGLLDQAKHMATQNVRFLSQHLDLAPFIFLEPSCLSAFVDDYRNLVNEPDQAAAVQVAEQCFTAEAWLNLQFDEYGKNLQWDDQPRNILLHGHCHQKALWGTADSLNLLRRIPNATVSEIDSGCCGVAGSFGYEHYALSLKIANQRLLPAIQNAPDSIVAAPGTSCRTQITENGYAALHTVQILANSLKQR